MCLWVSPSDSTSAVFAQVLGKGMSNDVEKWAEATLNLLEIQPRFISSSGLPLSEVQPDFSRKPAYFAKYSIYEGVLWNSINNR